MFRSKWGRFFMAFVFTGPFAVMFAVAQRTCRSLAAAEEAFSSTPASMEAMAAWTRLVADQLRRLSFVVAGMAFVLLVGSAYLYGVLCQKGKAAESPGKENRP